MRRLRPLSPLVAAGLLAACGQPQPTAIGPAPIDARERDAAAAIAAPPAPKLALVGCAPPADVGPVWVDVSAPGFTQSSCGIADGRLTLTFALAPGGELTLWNGTKLTADAAGKVAASIPATALLAALPAADLAVDASTLGDSATPLPIVAGDLTLTLQAKIGSLVANVRDDGAKRHAIGWTGHPDCALVALAAPPMAIVGHCAGSDDIGVFATGFPTDTELVGSCVADDGTRTSYHVRNEVITLTGADGRDIGQKTFEPPKLGSHARCTITLIDDKVVGGYVLGPDRTMLLAAIASQLPVPVVSR